MNWKYCIQHAWDEKRTGWADAFVRPADATCGGESLWVTIECRDLGGTPFVVLNSHDDGTDLAVDAADFSRTGFVEWITAWLGERGFLVADLVEAPLADFAGTHPHADVLFRLSTEGQAGSPMPGD